MVELLADYDLTEEFIEEELKDERFEDLQDEASVRASEQEYREAALRVVLQRNDFLLPNLIDMFYTHKTLNVSPFYQRRSRWDTPRKSKLIESFLVNIPVPPIFLYENDLAKYEVMDGQQRVSAVLEYFDNQFALRGLEILPSLTGKRFHELPGEIRAGLQRRSLSAFILLKESTPSPESAGLLRRHVFQRLNTGGVRLNAQEIRNSVNPGRFNDLLRELSRHPLFTSMWDIPPLEPDESTAPSPGLRRNRLFRYMRDVELVLRVLALLDPNDIAGGMKSTLDNAMSKYSDISDKELQQLKERFLVALELAEAIGGKEVFRPLNSDGIRGRPSAPLFDGMMVALMRKADQADQIRICAQQIKDAIEAEFQKSDFYELVVGRANTRSATLERSQHIEQLIESTLVK